MALPVKELKSILKDRGIDITGKPARMLLPCARRMHSLLPCCCLSLHEGWHGLLPAAGVAEKGELVQLILDRCKGVSYYK